jgi:hypothetical protein
MFRQQQRRSCPLAVTLRFNGRCWLGLFTECDRCSGNNNVAHAHSPLRCASAQAIRAAAAPLSMCDIETCCSDDTDASRSRKEFDLHVRGSRFGPLAALFSCKLPYQGHTSRAVGRIRVFPNRERMKRCNAFEFQGHLQARADDRDLGTRQGRYMTERSRGERHTVIGSAGRLGGGAG